MVVQIRNYLTKILYLNQKNLLLLKFCHNLNKIYRDSYGMFCVNGILFNHESPYRGKRLLLEKSQEPLEEFTQVFKTV